MRQGEIQECSQREDRQNQTRSASPSVCNSHLNIYLEQIHFNEFSAKLNQLIKPRSRDQKCKTNAGRDLCIPALGRRAPGERALARALLVSSAKTALRRAWDPRGERIRGHAREEQSFGSGDHGRDTIPRPQARRRFWSNADHASASVPSDSRERNAPRTTSPGTQTERHRD